jgi:hypothetical protein
VDGLVIGSELFVRDTMRRVRSESDVRRHRLARTADTVSLSPVLVTSPGFPQQKLMTPMSPFEFRKNEALV